MNTLSHISINAILHRIQLHVTYMIGLTLEFGVISSLAHGLLGILVDLRLPEQ